MTTQSGVCQSCGMPMSSPEHFGTEKGGEPSTLYCTYCYQNGMFTHPDATVDQMAEHAGAVLSQMFEMPPEKAIAFSKEQIQNLYRWSGRMVPSCESCGMPLVSDQDAGTETDGSHSSRYCTHCYQNGSFTEPDLTREAMIEKYSPLLAAQYGMPVHKAREMVTGFSATLPRWQ